MSSVSEKRRVIYPYCGGEPLWPSLAWNLRLQASLHFKAQEKLFAACNEICVCMCVPYAHVCECFCFLVCFQITTLAGPRLPVTRESPICRGSHGLLLTHPQSARGNNSEPSPPSLQFTAPVAHYCGSPVHEQAATDQSVISVINRC